MARSTKSPPSRIVKKAAQLAEREYLIEFARFARGDPLLTAFEEGFAASMERLGRTQDGPLPSEKQRKVLDQIVKKIGFHCEPLAPTLKREAEEDELCGADGWPIEPQLQQEDYDC